ncbi:MAG: hypothetical protein WA840_09285 [Caulobacteraceae bacterium]
MLAAGLSFHPRKTRFLGFAPVFLLQMLTATGLEVAPLRAQA